MKHGLQRLGGILKRIEVVPTNWSLFQNNSWSTVYDEENRGDVDVDDLIGSGIQITDREVIGYILAGLPSKFGPLITIIDA